MRGHCSDIRIVQMSLRHLYKLHLLCYNSQKYEGRFYE